jgi:hypothetical protein
LAETEVECFAIIDEDWKGDKYTQASKSYWAQCSLAPFQQTLEQRKIIMETLLDVAVNDANDKRKGLYFAALLAKAIGSIRAKLSISEDPDAIIDASLNDLLPTTRDLGLTFLEEWPKTDFWVKK